MTNKQTVLGVAAGIVIAAGVISWLFFGGSVPGREEPGTSVQAAVNATMKNSVVSREQNGRKLWEFHVDEVENIKDKNEAAFKGITGKVYRDDGSVLDVRADRGVALIGKNDFSLMGNVKAVLSSGGVLTADRVDYLEKKQFVRARGHVDITKDGWRATGDEAETTTEFKRLKLRGRAKVEKGGNE